MANDECSIICRSLLACGDFRQCVWRMGEGSFHLRGEVRDRQSEYERNREFQAIVAMKLQLGKKVA